MFNSIIGSAMTVGEFLLSIGCALVLGILTSLVFSKGSRYTSSWKISIALLPAVVAMIIMMVNGNIGAGLGVAGTFALVRFRSMPGSAREVTGLFFAVALGLICGMGHVGIAVLFFIVIAAVMLVLNAIRFGEKDTSLRLLKITIPENLDYEEIFSDVFEKYTSYCEMIRVKTSNMGTLYDLTYEVILKNGVKTKEFIDEIRCRNGNLNITFGREIDSTSSM